MSTQSVAGGELDRMDRARMNPIATTNSIAIMNQTTTEKSYTNNDNLENGSRPSSTMNDNSSAPSIIVGNPSSQTMGDGIDAPRVQSSTKTTVSDGGSGRAVSPEVNNSIADLPPQNSSLGNPPLHAMDAAVDAPCAQSAKMKVSDSSSQAAACPEIADSIQSPPAQNNNTHKKKRGASQELAGLHKKIACNVRSDSSSETNAATSSSGRIQQSGKETVSADGDSSSPAAVSSEGADNIQSPPKKKKRRANQKPTVSHKKLARKKRRSVHSNGANPASEEERQETARSSRNSVDSHDKKKPANEEQQTVSASNSADSHEKPASDEERPTVPSSNSAGSNDKKPAVAEEKQTARSSNSAAAGSSSAETKAAATITSNNVGSPSLSYREYMTPRGPMPEGLVQYSHTIDASLPPRPSILRMSIRADDFIRRLGHTVAEAAFDLSDSVHAITHINGVYYEVVRDSYAMDDIPIGKKGPTVYWYAEKQKIGETWDRNYREVMYTLKNPDVSPVELFPLWHMDNCFGKEEDTAAKNIVQDLQFQIVLDNNLPFAQRELNRMLLEDGAGNFGFNRQTFTQLMEIGCQDYFDKPNGRMMEFLMCDSDVLDEREALILAATNALWELIEPLLLEEKEYVLFCLSSWCTGKKPGIL